MSVGAPGDGRTVLVVEDDHEIAELEAALRRRPAEPPDAAAGRTAHRPQPLAPRPPGDDAYRTWG